MPEGLYQYGGLSLNGDDGQEVGGLFGMIGRGLNNASGKTALNQFNAQEAEKARQFEASEAQKNRDFQQMMSSTAYRRAAADMKAAGINPATLTGLNGSSGASSTPAGASAAGHAASSSSGSGFDAVIGALVKIAIAAAA